MLRDGWSVQTAFWDRVSYEESRFSWLPSTSRKPQIGWSYVCLEGLELFDLEDSHGIRVLQIKIISRFCGSLNYIKHLKADKPTVLVFQIGRLLTGNPQVLRYSLFYDSFHAS